MITTAKKLADEREHPLGARDPEPGDGPPTDGQRMSGAVSAGIQEGGRAMLRYLPKERCLRFETI